MRLNRITAFVFPLFTAALFVSAAHGFKVGEDAVNVGQAAQAVVKQLDDSQKQVALLPADSPLQVNWHFIPKDDRKGLELNEMSDAQRTATHELLQGLLSKMGYNKTTKIMDLERLLKELKAKHGGKGPIRDHLRYYLTFFGDPNGTDPFGISFEGHHLSLNFVVQGDKIISSSPQFFATNPATVKSENNVNIPLGRRVLRFEETLAFELVNSLSKDQMALTKISDEPLSEIRAAGEAQPPQSEAVGIEWKQLSKTQRNLLRRLIVEYIKAVPQATATERMNAIKQSGFNNVYFAWAGATNPGIGHYYRIQGPTFLIEFVNTQPDADGNPANHIHCVWRDMRGDFGKSIGK